MHWSTILKIIIAFVLVGAIVFFVLEIYKKNKGSAEPTKEAAVASVDTDTVPKLIQELDDLRNKGKSEAEIHVADLLPPKNFVYPQKKDAMVYVPPQQGRIGSAKQFGTTCRSDRECPKNTTCNKQGYCIPIFNLFDADSYNEIMGRGRSGEEENTVKLTTSR
jgi:hypothetical protein